MLNHTRRLARRPDRLSPRWSGRSDEPIPGGARWRYVFGSTLAAVFLIQALTGVLMMTAYSPSSSTAWGSVFYISNEMWMGWFIRGLHHFGSQTVMVLLVFHLLQVLIAGAYRCPARSTGGSAWLLLFLTLGFSQTGYLLPWDQKGYWATKVATNIMGGARSSAPTSRRSSSAGPSTATRRSPGSTACTSASCPRCCSSAWPPTSPCSGGTA